MVAARRFAPRLRAVAVALLALGASAGLTPAARAADTLYWGDGSAIMFAGLDGRGATPFDTGATQTSLPTGFAIDSAGGRIYWANVGDSRIAWAALDGSDSDVLDTTGAPVISPFGLTIDPAGGRIYWANVGDNSIASASLGGGDGRTLDTTGATVKQPKGVAIDPAGGRIYWANSLTDTIAFARLSGGDGGTFNPTGAIFNPTGVAIDPVDGRIYWANHASSGSIGSVRLDGGDKRVLGTLGAQIAFPAGVAIDPVARRIYWGNNGATKVSSAALTGGDGRNVVTQATISQGNYPILQLAPGPLTPPTLVGGTSVGSMLTCSPATWAPDVIASFFFQAPQSVTIQWSRDGQDIPGANQSTLTADAVGDYRCRGTAENHAGSAAQTSDPHHVAAVSRSGGDGGGGAGGGSGGLATFGFDTRVALTPARTLRSARGPLPVRIANDNAFAISGRLAGQTTKPVAGRRRTVLAARTFTLAAQQTRTVKLSLPKTLRAVLARRQRLTLRLTAVVTDPVGRQRSIARPITLKLKPRARRRH